MSTISTYVCSTESSEAEASVSSERESSVVLMRKNRTVPTRLITVRAMKTVLRSLSEGGKKK